MFTSGIFPGGRRGAVSLTYDDGYDQHLDHAIPDLDAAGLRATFYLPTGPRSTSFHTRRDAWRAAAGRGHELGNHTVHHPCSCVHPWVKPNFSLEAYSLGRMETELVEASAALDELIGQSAPRSYAYTCYEDFVGPQRQSYRPLVGRLFPAARGGPAAGEIPSIDPMDCDLAWLPSWTMHPKIRIDQLQAHIDSAIEHRRWVVLTFHGVAGGHELDVSRDTHRQLLRHITARADSLYCDTFLHVAQTIRASINRPWR